MVPDDDDRKVKDLIAAAKAGDANIDPATAADLARWFGLPSYQQIAEGEVAAPPRKPEDPQVVARREAIARAIDAIDMELTERLHTQWDGAEDLIKFEAVELTRVDVNFSAIDPVLVARADIADPRFVELTTEMRDDLNECTPQAVLRDLHRPELTFHLHFEVDESTAIAVEHIDVTAVVREVFGTRYKLEFDPRTVSTEIRELLAPMRSAKRERWADIRTPGRTVSE